MAFLDVNTTVENLTTVLGYLGCQIMEFDFLLLGAFDVKSVAFEDSAFILPEHFDFLLSLGLSALTIDG